MTYLHQSTVLLFLMVVVSCGESERYEGARIVWDKHANGAEKTVHQFLTDPGDFSADYYYQAYFENGNLKISGLENRQIRKGEWEVYFETGELKAVITFDNGILHGPTTLLDKNGAIVVSDTAKNGNLKTDSNELKWLIKEHFDLSENRTNWNDSLKMAIDSLQNIIGN